MPCVLANSSSPHYCFLFRCKDNIAHDYSRYCDPSMGRGEYSNTLKYSVGSLTAQERKSLRSPH